jgi:hypothetical protein
MYARPQCSKCRATDTRPSHRRLWEKPFSWLIVPFRCRACRVRFWKIRFALPQKKDSASCCLEKAWRHGGMVHDMTKRGWRLRYQRQCSQQARH